MKFITAFNPLPNDKILDVTNLKAFADNISNVTKVATSLYDRVENTVEKGENAGSHSIFRSSAL